MRFEGTDYTISKIASLVKLLEYDNAETFKTLFNELMVEYGHPEIHVARVGNLTNLYNGLESWIRDYIQLFPIFDDKLGGGVLQVARGPGGNLTFCNESV